LGGSVAGLGGAWAGQWPPSAGGGLGRCPVDFGLAIRLPCVIGDARRRLEPTPFPYVGFFFWPTDQAISAAALNRS
jgi:hypothetical protein